MALVCLLYIDVLSHRLLTWPVKYPHILLTWHMFYSYYIKNMHSSLQINKNLHCTAVRAKTDHELKKVEVCENFSLKMIKNTYLQ